MKINTFMMMMITLANDHHSFTNFQKQPPTQFVYFFHEHGCHSWDGVPYSVARNRV